MTEPSFPLTTITGHSYKTAPHHHDVSGPFSQHHHQHHRHGAPMVDHVQEDDGQIACICGYYDDDGWTVACDSCNRWQHQLCYYPQYEDRSLPEELQHYCVDCRPQIQVDPQGAQARQTVRREEHASRINGVKRQPPKSHKKKVKEPGYTNGWPLEKSRHDRNSASPRDQPPPAKRPKTSHRPTDSVTTASAKGHARKRTATNVNHRRSLSRSPEYPADLYTEEFIRAHTNDDWAITNTNLHNSIGITNALADWLNAPDDVFREMHGHEKTDVLMRWDGDLDDIPGKAQLSFPEDRDERVNDNEGNVLSWKTVTVSESVAGGAYIGELKGHLGFKDEYMQDLANRWPHLRHPEPFVFFHPRLPIYVDARNEGTELRYVRRSCNPNARLQILVTDQTDYRLCFMATQQIDPGMEIAVSWDTSEALGKMIARTESVPSQKDMVQLSSWVSTVLANWGPCACQSTQCMMERFDRRGSAEDDDEASAVQMPKAIKKRKPGQQVSPLNTNFNSRSGSEARKPDPDDEPSDSHSTSGSAGRGSASRDITPSTHYSHTGSMSAIPELSARERKKLEKEEEMFRRQEEEQTGKGGKKKRNSGGSTLNTPSATSSKQLTFGNPKYADAGTSKQASLPSAKPGRKPKSSNAPKTPAQTITRIVKRPMPDYVHHEVQCDLDGEEAEKRKQVPLPRRPFLSTTQRLLQRCALNNARRRGPAATAEAVKIMNVDDKVGLHEAGAEPSSPSPRPISERPLLVGDLLTDTEMKDVEGEPAALPWVRIEPDDRQECIESALLSKSPDVPSHQPVDPPVPPWPSEAVHSTPEPSIPSLQTHKPTDMHLPMPPPPANPFAPAPSFIATSPNGVTGTSMIASPATLAAPLLFSPAVTAAVTPSPAKKKMSLSDYTKRSKAKDKESEVPRTERDSSPASVASGPAVAPLQASASDMARAEEGGSSAVEDDVKMEDVADTNTA